MSNTIKKQPYRYYSKESKPARKITNKKFRSVEKLKVRVGNFNFSVMRGVRGTCGWLTH